MLADALDGSQKSSALGAKQYWAAACVATAGELAPIDTLEQPVEVEAPRVVLTICSRATRASVDTYRAAIARSVLKAPHAAAAAQRSTWAPPPENSLQKPSSPAMGKGGHGGGAVGGGHSHNEEYPDDNWNLYQHVDRAEALNAEGDAKVS